MSNRRIFYLSDEICETLDRYADEEGVSDDAVVESCLTQVLIKIDDKLFMKKIEELNKIE